jgi:DNA-binding CsgD family transcriptional regulator
MLTAINLNEVQQQIYETLLDGAATVLELHHATDVAIGQIRYTLSTLEQLSLVGRLPTESGEADRFMAVAPEIALEALLVDREEEIRRTRSHIQLLAARFHASAKGRDPVDLVEVVTGHEAVLRRGEQLQRSARNEIRAIDKPPYANQSPEHFDPDTGVMPIQIQTMRRGVGYRVLYDAEGLARFHSIREDIEECGKLGEQARVMANCPVKMLIADDRLGIIPLRAAPVEFTSIVVVHHSGLLSALCEFFETLWAKAMPLSDHLSEDASRPDAPSVEEARLIALLMTGMPDQAIARQLGVSYRTFQRRLHDLMLRLGATTRFHLGVHATQRGWVNPAGEPG